jgi:hypothetical protein
MQEQHRRGERSNAWPRVNVRSFVVHDRVEMKFAKPTATISAPNLLGPPPPREEAAQDVRHGQPVREQGDDERPAQVRPDLGIPECRVNEYVAPAQPTRAMAQNASGRSVSARRAAQPRAVLAGTAVPASRSVLGF